MTELFLKRPIAIFLLAIGLFMVGTVAYLGLPIAPLPKIDLPTISISATLPGADPETMAATVAAPLERRLGQIAGVDELTSTSSQNTAQIIAQFSLSRDVTGAAHDVEAAINASGSDLPVDLPNPPTYRKLNPSDAPVLILAVTSQTLGSAQLYDASDSILAQNISQAKGVAQVTVSGAAKPAVRISVDPNQVAADGLSMDDIRTAITNDNVNQPKGSFTGTDQAMQIETNDVLQNAADYAPLIVSQNNGDILKLKDIATVAQGSENDRQVAWFNKDKAIIVIIQKQADANVIDTVDGIKKMLPQLEAWMPAGSKVSVLADRTITIRASVRDMEITLIISIVLVVLVILFALGRFTPTIAASVTVPLALAGTFAGMWLLGYSLNIISLLALIVCVGFVIDDAIVMIENISRYVEEGMTPVEAAKKGAKEITFTIISISISLIAVFIPLLFMGGIVGRMFREFAVTLTIAVAVSVIIAVTVTPVLYATMMSWRWKRGKGQKHEKHMGERMFDWMEGVYDVGLVWVMDNRIFMLFVWFGTVVATVILGMWISKGFFPNQDTGMITAQTEMRTDASFETMSSHQQEAAAIILKDPAVDDLGSSVGSGGFNATQNTGRMFIALKPQNERHATADEVIARLRPKLAKVDGMSTFLQNVQDIRVGGRSTKAQFQFALWDESLPELREWTPKLIDALKNAPGLTDVSSDQDAVAKQINIVVDRDMASRLGVDMADIDNALQNSFAQRQVSNIYTDRNQYHVVLEVDPQFLQSEAALDSVFIKSATGQQVRLGTIAHYVEATSPPSVRHQGQFPASTLSFNLPPGAALGDAANEIMKAAAAIHMPDTIKHDFAGSAKAFTQSLSNEPILIAAAFISIYLVLGILYESTIHPLTIISTLPSAGLGAILALIITGNDLSIISVIGVILLMGIVKKNGIMLVDFAIVAERNGVPPREAIMDACRKRFRPIMMTTLAAVLGAVPLIVSSGNGSELRRPLGISIVGGLLVSQLLTLYTTPVVYLALDRFRKRKYA